MKLFRSFFILVAGGLAADVHAALSSSSALAGWDLSQPVHGLHLERVKAVRAAATSDGPAKHVSRLHSLRAAPGMRPFSSSLGRALRSASPPTRHAHGYQNISKAGAFSTQYAIQCGWDGVPVWLLLDTGSADTWAVQDGFECDSRVSGEQRQCGFGNPLVKGFGGGVIQDLHFNLRYGSGEKVVGPMGYSDLACGGIQVTGQQVGLANYTFWHGNNLTVGILGLAYPSITSAFYGEPGNEAAWNAITYTPFLTNAITQGVIDPVFSVALVKNSSGGMLAWGGLPPLDWRGGSSATTDLVIANLVGQPETSWRYSFYTIIPDGIKWGQTMDETKFPYIIDTGTTMNYLPPPLAEAIAMALASGGAGPYILGDVFLQNVVAVFDVGAGQMRFYPRP